MGGLRAAQKRMTRELLLDQGLGLFEAKGYAATTVDDIAAAAGTTRQTFYAHFPSKSHVMQSLIETVDEMLTSVDDPPLSAAVQSGDVDQLRTWLARKVDQWAQIRPYVMAAHEAATQDPEIAAAVTGWFESAIGDICTGLERAGRYQPSSRRIRATLAFGQLEFFSRHWFRTGWDVDRDETVDLLTDSWRSLLVE